jgi:uncharacterized surface protein with fasciclin (FAS1) repeats
MLPLGSQQIALWRFIMKNVLAFGLLVAVSLSACAPAAKPTATVAPVTAPVTAPAAAPAAVGNIVAVAAGNPNFSTLVAAVKAAGLVEALSGPGPLTVFAPTNDAFAKLPAGTVEFLLKPENKPRLVAILTYHVLAGKVMAADALKLDGKPATTLNGQFIAVSVKDGNVLLNGAKVLIADVPASNGVIHAIDTVLLPQ